MLHDDSINDNKEKAKDDRCFVQVINFFQVNWTVGLSRRVHETFVMRGETWILSKLHLVQESNRLIAGNFDLSLK
jgi:hypothetical protein